MTTRRKRTVVKQKTTYDRVIGIDLGNGQIKVRSRFSDGTIYELTYPSAFSLKRHVGSGMNVGGGALNLDVFKIDGVEYVWGKGVTHLTEFTNTYGHEGRYKTEPYKIMAQIVMAKIVKELDIHPSESIFLVTGVPSIETDTEAEMDIEKAFLGERGGVHEVEVNGVNRMFKIAKVEVMSQAVASVVGRLLDDDGRTVREEYFNMKIGVIDIGAGTTDLDVILDLNRLNVYDSVRKGFRNVYESIREAIKEKFPAQKPSDYELLEIINNAPEETVKEGGELIVRRKYIYKPSMRSTKEVNFEDALVDGVYEVTMAIQEAIMARWTTHEDMDEVLLVGGGAELFKDYMEHIVGKVVIPENNSTSNVLGYYRMGVNMAIEGEEE